MTSQKFVELYHVTCIFYIFLDSTIEISGLDFPHIPIFRKIKNGRTANFAKIGCLTVESPTCDLRWSRLVAPCRLESGTTPADSVLRRTVGVRPRIGGCPVSETTGRAVRNSTERAIRDSTERAIRDSMERAIRDSMERAIRDSTERAIRDWMERAVRDSMERAVRGSLG